MKNKNRRYILAIVFSAILWAGGSRFSFAHDLIECGNTVDCLRQIKDLNHEVYHATLDVETAIENIDINIATLNANVEGFPEFVTSLDNNMSDTLKVAVTYFVINLFLTAFNLVLFVYKR